jgi:hypothetical protein
MITLALSFKLRVHVSIIMKLNRIFDALCTHNDTIYAMYKVNIILAMSQLLCKNRVASLIYFWLIYMEQLMFCTLCFFRMLKIDFGVIGENGEIFGVWVYLSLGQFINSRSAFI